MPVPGIWELNGYGDPVYTNKPYPWHKFFEVKPPLVPHEQNYTGLYQPHRPGSRRLERPRRIHPHRLGDLERDALGQRP